MDTILIFSRVIFVYCNSLHDTFRFFEFGDLAYLLFNILF